MFAAALLINGIRGDLMKGPPSLTFNNDGGCWGYWPQPMFHYGKPHITAFVGMFWQIMWILPLSWPAVCCDLIHAFEDMMDYYNMLPTDVSKWMLVQYEPSDAVNELTFAKWVVGDFIGFLRTVRDWKEYEIGVVMIRPAKQNKTKQNTNTRRHS